MSLGFNSYGTQCPCFWIIPNTFKRFETVVWSILQVQLIPDMSFHEVMPPILRLQTFLVHQSILYLQHQNHFSKRLNRTLLALGNCRFPAQISLTLSRHFSLSFIAFGRSSGLHPVSSHSCCMYVRAGRPAIAWPYAGVHKSTSLMSSSLLLQQCPACLVRLTCIVFVAV